MLKQMLTAIAVTGLMVTGATADDFDDYRDAREDAREAWWDYQEELREDPYDDDVRDAWQEYCEAQRELRRFPVRTPYYGRPIRTRSVYAPRVYTQPVYRVYRPVVRTTWRVVTYPTGYYYYR